MESREPVAAGSFYPSSAAEIKRMLEGFFSKTRREQLSRAVISPHAGYPYSGRLSAISISKLKEAKTFVILSPSHSGIGAAISVSPHESWKTPLGTVPVDRALSEEIVGNSGAEFDELAHLGEHSIELQLPLLQYLFKGFRVVAVTIMSQDLNELLQLGDALASLKGSISFIASGDFSHHIPLKSAEEKDGEAIKLIEELKAEEFHSLVTEKNLSICGLAPFTVLMEYCRKTSIKQGKLLEYTTSAETLGDTSSVVGYASVIFT